MSDNPRIMIMAGGTGGHVFPALAVADQLLAVDAKISWLGTRRGIESELVPANDIPITYLDIEGIQCAVFRGLINGAFDGCIQETFHGTIKAVHGHESTRSLVFYGASCHLEGVQH